MTQEFKHKMCESIINGISLALKGMYRVYCSVFISFLLCLGFFPSKIQLGTCVLYIFISNTCCHFQYSTKIIPWFLWKTTNNKLNRKVSTTIQNFVAFLKRGVFLIYAFFYFRYFVLFYFILFCTFAKDKWPT